jgi:DNA-directed RNA polymerase subunit RPC12/RpoP
VTLKHYPGQKVRLVECPFCGARLLGKDVKTGQHFFDEHGPADAGLTPLGERREDETEPDDLDAGKRRVPP